MNAPSAAARLEATAPLIAPGPHSADKLTAALRLAEQGHRVFPLAINGKVPAIDGNWRVVATSDPARIRSLWTCPVMDVALDYNIGIAIDQKTVVLDVDVRDGKKGEQNLAAWQAINGDLPATYEVRTASGGRHLYFACENSSGFPKELAGHVDIKGEGGYVVAPGSTINGRDYEVVQDLPIAGAAPPLQSLANTRKVRQKAANMKPLVPLDEPANEARAIEWLKNDAPKAIEGSGGDDATILVANGVGDFGISQDTCLDLMAEHWNDTKASPPWDLDDLAAKVANAYRSRKTPLGTKVVPEFDAVALPIKAALPVQNVGNFVWNTKQDSLVRGFINRGMLVLMSGLSNAGKSPLALDVAVAIAKGHAWRGRKVKPGYVLHISTEGWTGLANRMEAIRRTHFDGTPEAPLDFVAMAINLRTSPKDVDAIVGAIKARAEHFGLEPGLVIVDTLSHALAGGDESNPEHVRALLRNCKRIANSTGAAVMLLHHPNKDASSDYRGSSILLNDIDLLIKVEADKRARRTRVTTPRVKEYAEIEALAFQIKVLDLGKDPEGDAITSVVVDWIEQAEEEFAAPLTGPQMSALSALEDLLKRGKRPSATFTAWATALQKVRAAKGKKGGHRQALNRAIPVLVQAGLIVKTSSGEYVRTTSK